MNSYAFSSYGGPLERIESANPEPLGSEVLLRLSACGVCHSDIHMWHGEFDLGGGKKLDVRSGRELPFTLGHEIAGTVVAAGPDAEVELGASVVAFPWIGCGDCRWCNTDREHLCPRPRALGTHLPGGFADHVLVPHPRYLFAHGDTPSELACTYACSGLTAYGALAKVVDLLETPLVVIGAGGVGFAALVLGRAMTDREIIVVEIDPAKMDRAREAGAAHVVDGRDPAAVKALRGLTGGGASAVIDCVGSEPSAALGFRVVGRSGTLVIVGLHGGSLTVPLPLLPLKDVTIRGSDLGSLEQMRELMELVRQGGLQPIPLETRPLAGAQQALDDLAAGRVMGRAVLVP